MEPSKAGGALDTLLTSRLDEDEQFVETLNYLNSELRLGAGTTEHRLRMALEDRELELNEQYLEQIERINTQVQSFVGKIRSMNSICHDLTQQIQTNKEKTRELLKKTTVLQGDKKQLSARKAYLDDFFGKYSLSEEEEEVLKLNDKQQNALSEAFFKAFKRLIEVNKSVAEQILIEPEKLALLEIAQLLSEKIENACSTLYNSVQRECRLLNVEFIDLKPALVNAFELLHQREELFAKALEDYGNSRKGFVVRAFLDTLTKGANKASGGGGPIEQLSTEPLRYVSEMLAWIQHTVAVEKEMLASLLRGCGSRRGAEITLPEQSRSVLSSISEALCQPLRLRVEQCITKEGNCIVLYRLSTLLLYYAENYQEILSTDSHLVLCCRDLNELCSNMFFSAVNSAVHRILANARVPDYDLFPVHSINQTLLLLRDILESQNDGAFSVISDKKGLYNKIFLHILDPLLQSIQLVCSNLDDPLDMAVYMLNCLNAIRSVIILYQYTDAKMEMIKAQIEANEDVLVSEQASRALTETDMLELFTKAQAHQPNQGPLSKIAGMEPERVRASLVQFEQFLTCPEGQNCNQAVKISSARIRDNIQRRTFEHIIAAYAVVWQKITAPENAYPEMEHLRPVDELKALLFKKEGEK